MSSVTATKGMGLSSIKVAWAHPTKYLMGGDLLGYYIKYQAVRQGGEPIADLQAQPVLTAMVCANHSELILTNLSLFTMYKIEVTSLTADGIRNYSEPVYGGIYSVDPILPEEGRGALKNVLNGEASPRGPIYPYRFIYYF